jgi:hypothetical protein
VLRTISATRACGPLPISRMRSASRIASSTSCVIMNTVWCVSAQMLQQLVLDGAARQRVERAEGLVEQQHLGLDGEGARDAHALLHAAGELARLLVDGAVQADHRHVLFDMGVDLCRRPSRATLRTAKAMFLRTVSQGISAWPWNTTPRSRLGPTTSRPSMKT